MKILKYFIGDYPIFDDDRNYENYGELPDFHWWYYLFLIPLFANLIYGIYALLFQ